MAERVGERLLGKVSASPQRVWSRQLARVAPASWQMMAYPLRTWQRSSSCSLGFLAAHRANTQCLGAAGRLGGCQRWGHGETQPCRRGPGSPSRKTSGRVCVCQRVCACKSVSMWGAGITRN